MPRNILLAFLTLTLSASLLGQSTQLRFEHLDDRDGLSHNRVTSIYKDKLGYIWFGTLSGLNRFDGHEVQVLRSEEGDPYAMHNSNVIWIKEGPGKHIWIKSSYGVFAYDIYLEQYIDISEQLGYLNIDNYNLRTIVTDQEGSYWFLVDGFGISKYDIGMDSLYHVQIDQTRVATSIQLDPFGNLVSIYQDGVVEIIDVSSNRVEHQFSYPEELRDNPDLRALVDRDGGYWFYSPEFPTDIHYLDLRQKEHRVLKDELIGSKLVSGIIEDQGGDLIIGMDHFGLSILDKNNWSIEHFRHNPSDPKSLSHNTVICLYKDYEDMVWIGTNKGGINYFSPRNIGFQFYKQPGNVSLYDNDILQIVPGKDQNKLWIGTDGGGLLEFDIRKGEFRTVAKKDQVGNISSNIIVSMAKDHQNGLWVGTYLGGLNYYKDDRYQLYLHDEKDSNSISNNSIWKLFVDSKGQLWVGSLKNGVDVYDEKFRKVFRFCRQSGQIHSNYVTAFAEDSRGRIWIGTGYGIDVFDPADSSFTHILRDDSKPQSLSNNSVVTMYMDSKDNMWIGTMHGLNKINITSGKLENYSVNDGLPHDIVTSIAEDREGNLWFGTYKGLSKMSMVDGVRLQFENFTVSDGLQGEMFNERSVASLPNGDLAFGGKNGLNIFDPEKIVNKKKLDKLLFVDFFISNHQIKPGDEYNDRRWFENGINQVSNLELKHFENSFSVGFTSLQFSQQRNTRFKFRLLGFDSTWVSHHNVQRANFTNLDPGRYTFQVAVFDPSNEIDSTMREIDILIKKPYWRTPLAYIIYTFIIGLILYLINDFLVRRERFNAKIEKERLESHQMHELDLMKIKFFTNISHEFRTPLTLIMTPIERLMKQFTGESEEKHLMVAHRNAKRLLTLVNQLLDFRKMEVGQHKLSLSSGDLVLFTRNILGFFSDVSEDRRINLSFESDLDKFITYFDGDKMEKVLFNLLSNAFKFTNENGHVKVFLREILHEDHQSIIQIQVSDTGIGIPEKKQKKIFKRFFQVDDGAKAATINHGSGIGLSITKEFVEMHHGTIEVDSIEGEGSVFTIELPMKRIEHLMDSQTVISLSRETSETIQEGKSTVMIVEDNNDFRFYLQDNLRDAYNVLEAANGKEAWSLILKKKPDIVVSDIMMPEMDGIELCRKIKRDNRVAHIPVILLTSLYSDDQKLEGYEVGASEYITKPFNFEILLRSIASTIQLQKSIHDAEHRPGVTPTEIVITPRDEIMLEKAQQIVEDNISNSDFSVQDLSHELGMSRGQLYKKILEITGKTPIEYIRLIRIKRAAALLEKSQLTVSEVAYKVGFNTPKYFTKYFKAEYKVLPSRYASNSYESK